MMIYEPGSDENTHGSLETALKDNGFIYPGILAGKRKTPKTAGQPLKGIL